MSMSLPPSEVMPNLPVLQNWFVWVRRRAETPWGKKREDNDKRVEVETRYVCVCRDVSSVVTLNWMIGLL